MRDERGGVEDVRVGGGEGGLVMELGGWGWGWG